ncbi:MAG: hypothetical protein B7X58_10970 [Marinobacter sp. 34-60-7]|nr:MAG: hypothetical protein B7X58_10970 [Marinobacter sp. 34-60-7]
MTNANLSDLLNLDGEERYDVFLSLVAEEREIWILVNADNRFLKMFAEAYAKGEAGLTPRGLSLPDFFRKWVPGLTRDGLEVGVFPGLDKSVWITEAEELKRDLQDAMSDF